MIDSIDDVIAKPIEDINIGKVSLGFQELIKKETQPKKTGFFGKIFSPSEYAQRAGIHTLPQYKLFCGVERKTAKGLYIPELSRVWEGHSLLANWFNQLRSVTFAVDGNDGANWADGYLNYKDTADLVNSQNYPIVWTVVNGYLGVGTGNSYGIQLGRGNTAVTERDNKLVDLIAHSALATGVTYAGGAANITYDSTTKTWQSDIGRQVTGNAIADVVVAEMGLSLSVYNTKNMLTARDLVNPTETVAASTAVTFHYIIQQINPA